MMRTVVVPPTPHSQPTQHSKNRATGVVVVMLGGVGWGGAGWWWFHPQRTVTRAGPSLVGSRTLISNTTPSPHPPERDFAHARTVRGGASAPHPHEDQVCAGSAPPTHPRSSRTNTVRTPHRPSRPAWAARWGWGRCGHESAGTDEGRWGPRCDQLRERVRERRRSRGVIPAHEHRLSRLAMPAGGGKRDGVVTLPVVGTVVVMVGGWHSHVTQHSPMTTHNPTKGVRWGVKKRTPTN
jgi:hypothetical protein